ncbi:MAG TPA: MlaE family lipid ABC transporter permease subunit [Candidatus Cloacimonadota bacterium]|nr:MlaE family lipid ABC transporter permease subunit [Candidatus Cloacimonadota bacterium]
MAATETSLAYRNNILIITGRIDKFTVPKLLPVYRSYKLAELEKIDLQNVQHIDSAGVAFLDQIRQDFLTRQVEIINADSNTAGTINTFSSLAITRVAVPPKDNIFVQIGDGIFRWLDASKSAVYLVADIFYWSFVGIFDKKGQRKGSVTQQSIAIGMDALGIIALLSLILGLILALQSAAQLRQFGANIFVADLMAISMVTEMGPILTAIILAGRSGSAIASEIATMSVTEEIDALKMMAINPIRYVVVPKFHAITICIPLLVTASTLIGILGGLIIAVTYLDLSAVVFFNRIFEVLTMKDVLVGLGKSFFFAWVIVIIGSYYGFNVTGGAEGVGKVTTQSVVASIFWVIILDAINSLIFYF